MASAKQSPVFKQILIISNPASTNSRRTKSRAKALKRLFPDTPTTTIQTSPKGGEASKEVIIANKHLLGQNTLFCIAAGDGTVNLVVETLLTHPKLTDRMRKTAVLPLWGGNANDLAHMLNGYYYYGKLQRVFKNGKTIKIKPLKITLIQKDKPQEKVAACYASFGATGFAANQINSPSHRKKPLIHIAPVRMFWEITSVIKSLRDVPSFSIRENQHEKIFYEYALVNGSRMAKFERMPIRLTDNAFYVVRISKKHPIVLLYLLQILRKRRFGRITSNRRSFTLLEPTWLQLDGEVIELKAGTDIKIEISDKPFYALSKRLS